MVVYMKYHAYKIAHTYQGIHAVPLHTNKKKITVCMCIHYVIITGMYGVDVHSYKEALNAFSSAM